MKIAISIWNDCVSNVFDFSSRILLVDFENDKEISRSQIVLESRSLTQRAGQLENLEVDVLVCGAISRSLAEMVTASGIEVLAYITGSINDVLEAYKTGQLGQSQFTMPGCWPGARKGVVRCGQGGRGRGRCRRQGKQKNIEL